MIFRVYAHYADFCGNEENQEFGLYEASSIEEVQKVFPEHPLFGWLVEPAGVRHLPTQVMRPPAQSSW